MCASDPCIFCRIAQGDIPARLRYEDEDFVVFDDLHPQAAVHWLIVPRRHFANILGLSDPEAKPLAVALVTLLPKLVAQAGLTESGFRLVVNTGADAGQTVPHLHIHLLGGEPLPV